MINNDIYTTAGGYTGISVSNATVCGNEISGVENALTVGGNMIIQANYIDKLAGNTAGPHFDGIEIYGGNNTKVWGNTIKLTNPAGAWLDDTGAINLTAYYSGTNNIEMRGNWLGGGFPIYVDEQQGMQATNVSITDNRWYRGSYKWGTHLIRDGSSVTTWSGNVFDDNGQVISK